MSPRPPSHQFNKLIYQIYLLLFTSSIDLNLSLSIDSRIPLKEATDKGLQQFIIVFKNIRMEMSMDQKERSISLETIIGELCKQGLCHRPQLLAAIWQSSKKVILQHSLQGRSTQMANCFIAWSQKQPARYWFCLQPTETTMRQCSLRSASQSQDNLVAQLDRTAVITEISLFHNLPPAEKQYFRNDKDLLLRFFYLLVTKMKETIKNSKSMELAIESFGVVRVRQQCYLFQPVIFSDKLSSSLKYKRFGKQQHSESPQIMQEKSQDSKYRSKFADSILQHRSTSQLKKRPYFHQLVVDNEPSNTKIINDLLGAGLDPLTFNVSYSKLTNSSSQLLSKQFTRPPFAQGRLPCVIDKFSRTKGSQLTSIKVSNSIVVRIGSNYSPTVRNYYLDIKTKQIEQIVPQARIKLDSRIKGVLPATAQEQYQYVTGKKESKGKVKSSSDKQLEGRVLLRRELYSRYNQYYQKIVPNDCVSPLDKAVIERIVGQVKNLVKKIGRKDGSPLINSLMTEANNQYYIAYKKAVLDYILRDRQQLVRTGITIPFDRVPEWGHAHLGSIQCHIPLSTIKHSRSLLQLNHILFPETLNLIYLQNEKVSSFQLFKRRKQGQYRPYSILYYIKRNTNQLNETFTLLCQSWVKTISGIISTQLKGEPYQKMRQFYNSIHIVMSNRLKELVYGAISDILAEFLPFRASPSQEKNLLMISITESNQSICFIDDIEKVFRFELVEIVDRIVQATRRVPRVQSYLKISNELFIWGVQQTDEVVKQTKKELKSIVQQNYQKIKEYKQSLQRLQTIFQMIDRVAAWCRDSLSVSGLETVFRDIHQYQEEISAIRSYHMANMVVVDCLELKKKLTFHLKALKKLILDTVDEKLKTKNSSILTRIRSSTQSICRDVRTTNELVQLYQSIQQIKQGEMPQIKSEIQQNVKDTIFMFKIQGFSAGLEVMRSMYLCRHNFEQLTLQIYRNEKRLYEDRLELQKKLRQKINHFQASTLSSFKDINSKIDSFDMRKLYSEYLSVLGEFKEKVERNKVTQRELNLQEEDLKWTPSTFPHAKDLENIVEPNYQLWQVVAEYDGCMRQWKYIELSHFDIDTAEAKMTAVDTKITKLISRLKNFAGLKIVYQLQNDVKQFLGQQVSIIKIFSNPGLKERHWSLFNKRLPLSGYDLKELTYGRIKLLYDYEKNLKVLMSISNQAGKEFEIENDKQDMQDYWNKLSFELDHLPDENIIFIPSEFLDQQVQLIEHHLTKTVLLKNSPFSKALGTMLTEWENWLLHGKKILVGFRASQEKFRLVRSMFKMDEINKLLPIQSTEYDSIQNIWKSVIKKILDQPRVTEFFKSQKMPQIIEEIGRKADFIRSSFHSYLTLKRLQFPRLYFLTEAAVLHLISLLASDQPSLALQTMAQLCFTGITQCLRLDPSSLLLKSRCDQLQIKCESLHSKKSKSRFFQQLVVLQKNMRENISIQIRLMNFQQFQKKIECSTLTSLNAALELQFTALARRHKEDLRPAIDRFEEMKMKIVNKIKIHSQNRLKYQYLISKIAALAERCRDLKVESKGNGAELERIAVFDYCGGQELKVAVMGLSIDYHHQYLGDQVATFLPLGSDKLLWQLAYTIAQHTAVLCHSCQTSKQIAHYTGQYAPELSCPSFSLQQNYQSCLMGMVTTNYWTFFDDHYLKLTMDRLAQLTHLYQLKKEKIERGESILTFRNNQLSINPNSLVFLVVNPQKIPKIPEGILTCTRSVTFVPPPLNIIKQYLKSHDKLNSIKEYLHILKSQCSHINVSAILEQCRTEVTQEGTIEIVRTSIWRHLSLDQQSQFVSLFCGGTDQKEQGQFKTIQEYISSKSDEIQSGLRWSNLAFVVGEQSCKSRIIAHFLSSKGEELFCQDKGINMSFIQEGVSEMNFTTYLQKARQRGKKYDQNQTIYIYIDSDLSCEQLRAVQLFIHTHQLRPEEPNPLKIIVQTSTLSSIEPSVLVDASIVGVRSSSCQDSPCFKQWVNELQVPSLDKTAIYQLQHSFQSLLNFVVKMQKRPFNDGKMALATRFFNFFSIFLSNLNGKQAQRMCQLQRQSYTFNSFIYCAFWSLGTCSLRTIQIQNLKKHINELFGEKLDLPGQLDQIYLTEDNEWAYWETLKQEFSGEKDTIPYYQVWVPTANNTKILTLMVRLVEQNHSMLLWGSQSGRSSLLNEISCFELSYNPFFIDCHKNTSTHHVSTLTRGKVLYGQSKHNLILVDDLHLPSTQICGILRTFIERGYCPSESPSGRLNESIGKPSVIATWKNNDDSDTRCFPRFLGRCIPIQLQKLQQKQLQCILKTYIVTFLPSPETDINFMKTETNLLNFLTHTLKVFPSLEPKHLKLLIESLCKNNSSRGHERYILQHLLIESQNILARIIPNHQKSHFFRHMCHYYSKLLTLQLKNQNQLKQINAGYLYAMREQRQGEKKQNVEERTQWMQQIISSKDSNYFISHQHTQILQRLFWTLKGNHSHVLILSHPSNGCRSLAKMAGWLLNLSPNDLTNTPVSILLEEVVKVLKTGGKVDECVNIFGQGVISAQPDLLKLVHSLIFSPEFHECFGQILMQQIIKSFNSQKKFLKKNVKKAQLIKKIRQKFNSIYHFCLCLSRKDYSVLMDEYPNFGRVRVVELQQWTPSALFAISRHFIPDKYEEVFPVLTSIEQEIKNKWYFPKKPASTTLLEVLTLYEKVMKMLQARVSSNDHSEMWTKRVKMNQQKLQSLQNQKRIYQSQHTDHFGTLSKITESISAASLSLQKLRQEQSTVRDEQQQLTTICTTLKLELQFSEHSIHEQYEAFIESNRYNFLSECDAYLESQSFRQIAAVYEFQIDKKSSQIIQFLYRLEHDYFHKLQTIDHSPLGTLHLLIERFNTKMSEHFAKQSVLSEKFIILTQKQRKLQQLFNTGVELQDKISDMKDEEQLLKQSLKDPMMKRYQQICKKIQQYEAVTNILIKYQHVLRSKNDTVSPIPASLVPVAALTAYMLAYQPLMPEHQLEQFESMVLMKLAQFKMKTSPEELKSFFTQEQQFQMTYNNMAVTDEWVNLLALQSTEMSVVALGQRQSITSWMKRSLNGKSCIWLKNPEDMKDLLQQDNLILIDHPARALLKRLQFLLVKPTCLANNFKSIRFQDEQLTVHQHCKVLFLYNSFQQVPEQLLFSGIFILKICNHKKRQLGLSLQDRLRRQKMVTNRSELVKSILKGHEEMTAIDEKMHSIITKMRKQNVVSEIIFKRIEEQGEVKLNTSKDIQNYKLELETIGNTVLAYRPLLEELNKLYEKYQQKLTFNCFLKIFAQVLEITDKRHLESVPTQLEGLLANMTDPVRRVPLQEKLKFDRLISRFLSAPITLILVLPDLSFGLEWIQQIIDAHPLSKFTPDCSISELKQKQLNMTTISRQEQIISFAELYENNTDKIKSSKIIILVLSYVNIPSILQTHATTLEVKNVQLIVRDRLEGKDRGRGMYYQRIADQRWLQKQKDKKETHIRDIEAEGWLDSC